MSEKLIFTFRFLLFLKPQVKSQDIQQDENNKVSIAGMFHGEITREELLNASELKLNNDLSQFHIISFTMVFGSTEDSLLFLENKKDGRLTDAMRDVIGKTKRKYILVFSHITCANTNGASLGLDKVEIEFNVLAKISSK